MQVFCRSKRSAVKLVSNLGIYAVSFKVSYKFERIMAEKKSSEKDYTGLYVMVILAIGLLAFNQYQIFTAGSIGNSANNIPSTGQIIVQQPKQSQVDMQAVLAKVMPKGIPEVYGPELKVSFDDPVKSLDILANFDADLNPGKGGIKFEELTQVQKDRYLKIGFMIACEYCCGVKSLITKDGQPSCSCAHSAAMRGLAKYLLKNHENEFTDEQILDHLTKWKTLFFPKQMVDKYLKSQGLSSGELPNQVGGC